MNLRYLVYSLFLILFFSINLEAQTKQKEVMFVITNTGDSILTSEILKNQTSEDQVTILIDGWPKTYKANEIKSYFQKNRRHSIFVKSDNQYKLARILVKGPYQLARSLANNGEFKFFLQVGQEWKSLDPHADDLKGYLSRQLPGFEQSYKGKKVLYDSFSLGKSISEYNLYKDPNYTILGFPEYRREFKIGFSGSLGSSSLSSDRFDEGFDASLGYNLGLVMNVQFTRSINLNFQFSYSKNSWENTDTDLRINTFNFTTLLGVDFFRPTKNFTLSFSAGPNFILDLNSQITFLNTIPNTKTSLSAINLGYDFQLGAAIGRKLDLFLSYQINPNIKTPDAGILGNDSFGIKVNTIRGGLVYYFLVR